LPTPSNSRKVQGLTSVLTDDAASGNFANVCFCHKSSRGSNLTPSNFGRLIFPIRGRYRLIGIERYEVEMVGLVDSPSQRLLRSVQGLSSRGRLAKRIYAFRNAYSNRGQCDDVGLEPKSIASFWAIFLFPLEDTKLLSRQLVSRSWVVELSSCRVVELSFFLGMAATPRPTL